MRYFAQRHGMLHFRNQIPPELSPYKIIGAKPFYAKSHIGSFFYQEVFLENFSVWLSHFLPSKDVWLIVEDDEPWLGMHIVLQNHLLHRYEQEEINLRQGQFNFDYLPKVEVQLFLRSGEEYVLFDFKPSLEILNSMDNIPNIKSFINNGLQKKRYPFLAKAIQATNEIIESIEHLLRMPFNIKHASNILHAIEKNYKRKNLTDNMKDAQIAQMFEARNIIKKNQGKKYPLHKIAQLIGTNETYLKRQFVKVFGITVSEYQAQKRDELVKWLLLHTEFELDIISKQVGIQSLTSLIHTFKSRNGITPTEWRRKYK